MPKQPLLDKVASLSRDRFVSLWNTSDSLDEATAKVRAVVGTPCPRWAVLARALACRREGADVKRFAD